MSNTHKKLSDLEAMKLAMGEAKKGSPFTSPNPNVGCVILDRDGNFLSSGFHERYGEAHAEINAIKKLSREQLSGAQVFVTLEPCAHEGKTGSCAKKLTEFDLKRVVYGLKDPNPLVDGKGAEILKAAGIPCEQFREGLKNELEETAEVFLWNYRHQKVFVSLKMATSLDGKIAMKNGDSKWITGEKSRDYVHVLRAAADAVLIGSGTLAKDDPRLDVRVPGLTKENKVVVLDRSAKLQNRHNEFQIEKIRHHSDEQSGDRSQDQSVIWIEGEKECEPAQVLAKLWELGIRSVFIEGGAKVASAFLKAQLVNRLHLFQAPVIMGEDAKSWTEDLRIGQMKDRLVLSQQSIQTFGEDFYLTGLIRDPQTGDQFRAI